MWHLNANPNISIAQGVQTWNFGSEGSGLELVSDFKGAFSQSMGTACMQAFGIGSSPRAHAIIWRDSHNFWWSQDNASDSIMINHTYNASDCALLLKRT